mgnify:FL=1
MKKIFRQLLIALMALGGIALGNTQDAKKTDWLSLVNGKDLAGWDIKSGTAD